MSSDPLYGPKAKIRNFKSDQDFEQIRSSLLGRGLLYEDTSFEYRLGQVEENEKGNWKDAVWRRPIEICGKPKFIDGKPRRFDALQGRLGDCWAVAAIQAITLNDQLIQHVVPFDQTFDEVNYIGAFHFRIWDLGIWYDVVVDDRLPVYEESNHLCYARSQSGDVFWGALLEKAYAKFWVADKVSYDVIRKGWPMTSLVNFTGGIVECITPAPRRLIRMITTYVGGGTMVKDMLLDAYKRNCVMMGEVSGQNVEQIKEVNLINRHVYVVTDLYKFDGAFLLRCLNPWGYKEWSGPWSDDHIYWWTQLDREIRLKLHINKEEGEFWMSEEDFEKYFKYVWFCHLGPGQFIDTHLHVDSNLTYWKTITRTGEWVNGVSAVGKSLDNRHNNPQIGIKLVVTENSIKDENGFCHVVIQLTHRQKYRRTECTEEERKNNTCKTYNCAFYIYDTNKLSNPYQHFGNEFFQNNNPVNGDPNFKQSQGRCYVSRHLLYPGTYCVVPCTENEGEESKFLLRLYTTCELEHWQVDTRISKSSPFVEDDLDHPDDSVRTMFNDLAQGENEVDWSGLKQILDANFKQTPFYFGIFTSTKNYILNLFIRFYSKRYSDESENENADFTKDQCRSMIAMLDYDISGTLNYKEFVELWNKINFWGRVFEQHKDGTVRHLRVDQVRDALASCGYEINTRTVHSLCHTYADQGGILLADFILCGVALETALSRCDEETLEYGDKLTLTLEQWVKNTLIL